MFDTAHIGDSVIYCRETHGLRPAEDYGTPARVIAVERGYSTIRVTVDNGDVLIMGIHQMLVLHCINVTRGHLMQMTKTDLQLRAAATYGEVLFKNRNTKTAMVEAILRLQER